jgi:beta-lactamase regulating signal transducer with metallopeptidase domain
MSPTLWALGRRSRLLVPEVLWARLDKDQWAALLAHELAHLRRRDHWIRPLELLAISFYWWLPVAWWVRRSMREAEEQCCDAWVVWLLPDSKRAYARTLVETIDFLAEPHPPLPLAASGFGTVASLRTRLSRIMKGTGPRVLSRRGAAKLSVSRPLVARLEPFGQRQVARSTR